MRIWKITFVREETVTVRGGDVHVAVRDAYDQLEYTSGIVAVVADSDDDDS